MEHCAGEGEGGGDAAKGVGGNAALVGEGAERKRRGRTHPSRKGENQKENARTFASKMVEDADRERLKGQIEGRRKKESHGSGGRDRGGLESGRKESWRESKGRKLQRLNGLYPRRRREGGSLLPLPPGLSFVPSLLPASRSPSPASPPAPSSALLLS